MSDNNFKYISDDLLGDIRIITQDNDIWFCATDIARILGYFKTQSITAILMKEDKTKYKIKTNGGEQFITFISKKGLHIILSKTRKIDIIKKNEIYKQLTNESFAENISNSCKETEFINKLIEVLKPFELKIFKKQYRVSKYRIDLYLPEINVAIEYDENNHKGYSCEEHEGRQKYIEQELGCKFVRVTDENSDEYNIGYIIKQILTRLRIKLG